MKQLRGYLQTPEQTARVYIQITRVSRFILLIVLQLITGVYKFSKNLGATSSIFLAALGTTEDPPIQGTKERNLSTSATRRPQFVHPSSVCLRSATSYGFLRYDKDVIRLHTNFIKPNSNTFMQL